MDVGTMRRHRGDAVAATGLVVAGDDQRGGVVAKERVERDEEDLVRLYLTDIGQYPLLNKDDEVRLAQQIEKGVAAKDSLESDSALANSKLSSAQRRRLVRTQREGARAERTFVQSNLRLVVSIAKKYQASGLPLLDLIQEGNLGLMHAVEKFDWRKGFKFSTYATWWIRQAITRGIANTGRTIRLPVHAGDTLARLQKARSRLELKYGRPATLGELATEVDMPEQKVTEALRFAAEPLSLSEPLREDSDAELGDVVEDRAAESPFEVAATTLLPSEIVRLLSPLDEREREILKLRYGLDRGEPRTLEEVGEHFQLTRERIRQIEARGDVEAPPSQHRHGRSRPAVGVGSAASARKRRHRTPLLMASAEAVPEFDNLTAFDNLPAAPLQQVLLCGDIHSNAEVAARVSAVATDEGCAVVLQVGDLGWRPGDERSAEMCEAVAGGGVPWVFIDGNHEHLGDLASRAAPHRSQRSPDGFDPDPDGLWGPTEPIQIAPMLWWAARGSRWTWRGHELRRVGRCVVTRLALSPAGPALVPARDDQPARPRRLGRRTAGRAGVPRRSRPRTCRGGIGVRTPRRYPDRRGEQRPGTRGSSAHRGPAGRARPLARRSLVVARHRAGGTDRGGGPGSERRAGQSGRARSSDAADAVSRFWRRGKPAALAHGDGLVSAARAPMGAAIGSGLAEAPNHDDNQSADDHGEQQFFHGASSSVTGWPKSSAQRMLRAHF